MESVKDIKAMITDYKMQVRQNLHPLHYADMKKSGLSDETIREAGIKSVSPDLINKKIGCNILELTSCYEIPYPDTNFCRYRVFYGDGTKKRPKYLQRKGTGNRLYIPSKVKPILNNASIPLYLTEGEKKALKATQEGLPCIALSGLWNWSDGKKELIPDFDQIALEGREVYLVPDSDWLQPNKHGYRKNLKRAVYELADRLKAKGVKVFVVLLPEGKEKIGLDDYLCKHTVKEFRALLTVEIKGLHERIAEATSDNIQDIISEIAAVQSETERAIYIEALSKKFRIGKRPIQKDISTYTKADNQGIKTVISANIKGLVELAKDETGTIVYLIKNEDAIEPVTIYEQDGILYSPPEKQYLPFNLARADEVIKWYQVDDDQRLFQDVLSYLKRFSYLPDNQWLIVACAVFLTYIQDHCDIHHLPMILFYAVPERGKSRTGKAAIYISYRGIYMVDLRETNLFRFSQNFGATIFLDIMNLWKKAERNGAEDILLLRYERGAKATRVIYPEKGAFKDSVFYEVYGSTFMATNEPLHKILDTRCIPIFMPNKPGNYENPTPEKAQELKDRLTAWRARVLDRSLPTVGAIHGLNGRLWDISLPLLQVCEMVYPQCFDDLKDALLEVAGDKVEDRRGSIEGQIIAALYELSPKGISEWTVKVSELLSKLNETRPEGHNLTSQYLGRKLKSIGLHTKIIMGYSHINLNREDFNILLTQYGLNNISDYTPKETLLNSTNLLNQEKSTSYVSRELVESEGNSTKTLLTEAIENKWKKSLVEFSRELGHTPDEIIIEGVRA